MISPSLRHMVTTNLFLISLGKIWYLADSPMVIEYIVQNIEIL